MTDPPFLFIIQILLCFKNLRAVEARELPEVSKH